MSYMLPQLVRECKIDGQTNCERCRQPLGGVGLRLRIMALRGTGVEGPDFECPLGKPWRAEPSRGVGDTIAKVTGFGDIFHGIVASKYGIPACQKCQEVIHEMNELGVDGCVREKSRIIDGLWSRRDQLKGWKRVIAKLPGSEHLAKAELSRLFDQATSQTKQTDSL